jgi:hypothetical protein
MNLGASSTRMLDPLERFSEIVFGLIMVLTFTCALSVAEAGREDVREMFVGALGCNLAWGIIDAAFYIIACLTGHGRSLVMLRRAQQCTDSTEARDVIASAIPERVAEALQLADYERIQAHLKQLPAGEIRPRLTAEDWRGAAGVFLLVFVSTLPVVLPFLFIHEAYLALRVSNAIAIVLLFAAGHMVARYAGLRKVLTGLAMVVIGAGLVAVAIALGG